jgi:hypothetical protein
MKESQPGMGNGVAAAMQADDEDEAEDDAIGLAVQNEVRMIFEIQMF